MSRHGFTVIELLVAVAVLLVASGVIASVTAPMHHGFDRSTGAGDITRTARAGLAVMADAARAAGTGIVIGPTPQSIGDLMPVVVPFRSLDTRSPAAPFGAATFVRATGSQSLLGDPIEEGDSVVRLDADAPCPGPDRSCGFRPGDAAVLLDRSIAEAVVVTDVNVGTGTLFLAAPVGRSVERGTVIAAVERTTYGLRRAGDGSARLVRITSGGAEQPVIDHAVELEISLWPDLARIRRVDVRLRVEAASAELRGPAGPFFRRPGTATHAVRWVPDVELSASVALRR